MRNMNWKTLGVLGGVAAAMLGLGASAAQAEPYARTYCNSQPAYIDYGPAYVPRTVTYVETPRYYTYPTTTVTYSTPVYQSYYVPRTYYPPIRQYRTGHSPYYGNYGYGRHGYGHRYGGHRDWGFGIAGGHHGGGLSFYYNDHR